MHQSDTMHRLFFALWPDAPLRAGIAAVAAQLQSEHLFGGRRMNADRYHLTLQFLGDFRPLRPSVRDAAIAAAGSVRLPAFDLVLDQVGSFARAGVWWLGAGTMASELLELRDELGAALVHAGVQVRSEPAFIPHLTVLRDVSAPLPSTAIAPLAWRVAQFVLIDSISSGGPAPYRLLGRWPLSDAPVPREG